MMILGRGQALAALLLVSAVSVAGCSTFGDDGSSAGITADNQPGQVAPITDDSSVSSNSLPPLGASGSTQVASANGSMPRVAATPGTDDTITNSTTAAPAAGTTAGAGAGGSGSFVSLNDVGQVSNTPGRNLAGDLTVEKLLGGWTVSSGSTQQCRLNLTYTAAGNSSDRYLASAPNCAITALSAVASWRLAGTQVQLFNGGGSMVGTLLLSGDHFVGTLAGGQAIQMTG